MAESPPSRTVSVGVQSLRRSIVQSLRSEIATTTLASGIGRDWVPPSVAQPMVATTSTPRATGVRAGLRVLTQGASRLGESRVRPADDSARAQRRYVLPPLVSRVNAPEGQALELGGFNQVLLSSVYVRFFRSFNFDYLRQDKDGVDRFPLGCAPRRA